MKDATLTTDHTPVHRQVLRGRQGDRLRLGREDTEWPGWIWCENDAGIGGWVPRPYLDLEEGRGILRRDYDATELSVTAGQRVQLEYEVNGWWWARTADGRAGWVPAAKLT